MLKDSGQRTCFDTGAVRDCHSGKGRCDLLPLDVAAMGMDSGVLSNIGDYVRTKNDAYLYASLSRFIDEKAFKNVSDMYLEVAKHFEDGAIKYGDRNWEKGIPEERYIDSAVRHYLKYKRGDVDERHDRAFAWNIVCLIWTHTHITKRD